MSFLMTKPILTNLSLKFFDQSVFYSVTFKKLSYFYVFNKFQKPFYRSVCYKSLNNGVNNIKQSNVSYSNYLTKIYKYLQIKKKIKTFI